MTLLDTLKAKRKEIAEREGRELFMVFQNKTLEATARALPKTKADLALIKGWGKRKIEKYGEEFLALVNHNARHASNTPGLFDTAPPGQKTVPLPGPAEPTPVLHVCHFLEAVNRALGTLGLCRVRGELGKVEYRQGNCYFKLKDTSGADAAVDCFMWRWDVEPHTHLLEEGLEVMVKGPPGVYKTGRFSVTVKSIEPVGEGALKKAFEALKHKLEAKGYFDPVRKRHLPEYMKHVALVTSSQGEAVNDFLKNIGAHGLRISLFDVRVEGEYAETEILRALRHANLLAPPPDVIALIRGGGSAESLAVFNSEKIADAIIASRTPIITGIGHERDETIADYVSDVRASTPTAAATEIRQGREVLHRRLESVEKGLLQMVQSRLETERFRIIRQGTALEAALRRIFEKMHAIVAHLHRLALVRAHALERARHALRFHAQALIGGIGKNVEKAQSRLTALEETISALNPEAVLARGYAIVRYAETGRALKSVAGIVPGDAIAVTVKDGALDAEVRRVIP